MNSDILKGKWNELKGNVKSSFGKLTDDDMLTIEGDSNKAAGLIQQRYGYTREEAERKWNEFTTNVTNGAQKLQDQADRTINNMKADVKNTVDDIKTENRKRA